MPVSSEMREIKRYSSTSSLSMPRGLSLSTASHDSMYSDDKQDGMYRSSPDLSQGSMPHTRSSSTDSGGEGGYYGNHSRQSSGSIGDYPTRRMSTTSSNRKSTSALPDPLQFIKVGGAQSLAEQAKKQMEVSKEGHIMRGKLDTTPTASVSDEPDWQSNFNSWKSRRKSHSHLPEKSPALEEEEQATRKQKTFSQIMAEKNQRGGHGPGMHVYPQDDNDSGIEGFKSHDKTANKRSTSETSKQKSSKIKDVAPWAAESSGEENSQSDSETNNSHQSGDTDSVFSDKSTPSKILSDDDTWVKQKQIVPTRATPVRTQKPSDNVSKVWESNLNDSPSKKEEKRFRDIPTNNSAKIKDITKSFEQKDKEANASPVVTPRRSDVRKSTDTSPLWKTNDITDGSSGRYRNSGKEPTSPISPKTPKSLLPHDQRYGHNKPDIQDSPKQDKKYVERMIKICQRPDNNRGFGFTLVGGLEKRQPVIVQRVSLGSAADVQEVLVDDEILEINGRSVSMLTMAQVQGIVDHGVKRGQIELKIRRYEQEDEPYDSMNEEEGTENQSNITNNTGSGGGKMDVQSDSSLSAEPSSLEDHSVTQSSRPDDSANLRLMDQLIQEQERETNNNQKNKRAPSPVAAEPPVTVSIALSNESAPSSHMTSYTADMQAPSDVTTTEERPTISMRRGPPVYQPDNSPVVLRRDKSAALQNSPSPPTPPRNQPPPLSQTNDTNGTDSGFGPPAALMRWQRRPKSEYRSPSEMEQERSKRLSSTLPYNSGATFSFDAKNFSKDDADVDRVSKDFVETVSISKPLESSPNSYKFNDSSRMEDWQQKHEQEQKPKQYQPIELNIPKVEHMTPQEKFEADQQRIRLQYEADKKRAEQAEQIKQEKQAVNTDKFMKSMEFQVQQTKKEAANQNLLNSQPINEPRFTSEPMTIKLPANSQGRQLMIDPRNQGDTDDSMLPEYSFRVDLKQNETAPPLRTLEAQSGLSHDDLLERERQRIREEEKQKLERERQEWLARQQREQSEHERKLREQEERLRQETQRLQQEQERVEREKALLAEKKAKEDMISPRYTSVTNTSVYLDSRSPTGSSQVSPTARSGPPSLDPKFHESSRGAKVPPPTAPKPGAKDKARLTRDDLLAMNRKATPLAKPELTENSAQNEPLSPTMREAPSKRELHSLNAVPKPRYHYGGTWIKDEEREPKTNSKVSSNTQENDRPFVIGKRSDLIHQRDYSNPNDHWLVREAEKRRLADRDNVESVTARAGPTRPSESSLVNRFRSDQEPPQRRNHRLSYPSSQFGDPRDPPTSSRPLSTSGSNLRSMDRNPETQFNVRSQNSLGNSNPGLSQTLPPSFSFSANARDSAPNSKPPRSLTNESDPVIAVSGKQKCSHCGEELGFGAAMVIESLGLYYHVQCFRCCVCHVALGSGAEGADVRVRVDKLHCRNCYSNDEAGLKFSKV